MKRAHEPKEPEEPAGPSQNSVWKSERSLQPNFYSNHVGEVIFSIGLLWAMEFVKQIVLKPVQD